MATRSRLAALAGAALLSAPLVVLPPRAEAALPAPVILNDGSQNGGAAQWVETQSQPDDGGGSVKQFVGTLLVQHAVGRSITFLRVDADFNGSDDTAAATPISVSPQTYATSAGGIETSRVTFSVALAKPAGFSCSFPTGVRSIDAPVRIRIADSTGEQSTTATTVVRFVEDLNCAGVQDQPVLTSTSQNVTSAVPGQAVAYTFTCADADVAGFGTDDDCDQASIRWRRLDDGATSTPVLKTGIDDDVTQVHQMTFPEQGFYVVEAQLANEDGVFRDVDGPTGGWWRLGNAAVNDATSTLSGSIAFQGASASVPPSINAGTGTIDAVATVADTGGAIQVIEWDATGDFIFERREYTVPSVVAGAIVHPELTESQRSQAISIATPGLVTVRARITDNGALDAADTIRRQLSISAQLRINALPTASDVTVETAEDTPLTIALSGMDTDSQPDPLTYEIASGPDPAAGTLGAVSGNQVTFTPAPDFSGATSFTYTVRDGGPSTVAAWATSATAMVSITVTPANDPPVAADAVVTVSSKSSATITLSATDVDGDSLTFSAPTTGPLHGTLICSGAECTYTPDRNYRGPDSFTFTVADGNGGSDTGTVDITVTPGRKPPRR